jgi:hypothetical protein
LSEAIPINRYSFLDGFRKGLNPSYALGFLELARNLDGNEHLVVGVDWYRPYSLLEAQKTAHEGLIRW